MENDLQRIQQQQRWLLEGAGGVEEKEGGSDITRANASPLCK